MTLVQGMVQVTLTNIVIFIQQLLQRTILLLHLPPLIPNPLLFNRIVPVKLQYLILWVHRNVLVTPHQILLTKDLLLLEWLPVLIRELHLWDLTIDNLPTAKTSKINLLLTPVQSSISFAHRCWQRGQILPI